MEESFYQCPYCWEDVSILVDVSQPDQNYIEDCEVCCNPLEFNLRVENNVIEIFSVDSLDQ